MRSTKRFIRNQRLASGVTPPVDRRSFLRGMVATSCFCSLSSRKKISMSHTPITINTKAADQRVRQHQPGQAVFQAIVPEEIDWKPFAAFPPSVRLAVLVGQPSQEGPYVIRVKVPRGVKLMPHKHPEDRTYTVISGVFYIGLGDQFDAGKLEAYPPGAVIVLPGDTAHFHWAKSGEYITQVNAIGPLGLNYLNPKDDPRNRDSGT
jgi:quercetin dioxygenase-like cupin family protein